MNVFCMSIADKQSLCMLGGRYYDLVSSAPNYHAVFINLSEKEMYCDYWYPIKDFSTPTTEYANKILTTVLKTILDDKRLRIGCDGGKGRTGLVFGIIAKSFGFPDPVGHVRKSYDLFAIETRPQEDFVRNFKPSITNRFLVMLVKLKAVMSKYFGSHI